MISRLDATDLLVAEVVALRAVVKHLLVDVAIRQPNPNDFLGDQYNRAVEDVAAFVARSDERERAEAIAEHAQEIIEEIYTVTVAIE